MTQVFIVPGTLPGLNEIVAANRSGCYIGAKQKRECDEVVGWALKRAKLTPVKHPVTVDVLWVEKSRRRDPDNIAAGTKFILDALQQQGVLAGDGHKHVEGISHRYDFDRTNPRVVVTLTEWED